MTTLALIRHAPATSTGRTLSGRQPGHSLSAEGRALAEGLANRLRRVRLVAIYASPLERTKETAEAIARHQRVGVRLHEGLLEVDYGDWTGRTFKSLSRLKRWRHVIATPSRAAFPNGESLAGLQARVVAACEEISGRHRRGTVAVVTHADAIKAAVSHYLGQPLDLFNRLVIAPASVSVLDVPADGMPRLIALNTSGEPHLWK
jgi:probable phosphoglycerate mutase